MLSRLTDRLSSHYLFFLAHSCMEARLLRTVPPSPEHAESVC